MNKDEEIVKKILENMDYKDIIFEPDGNIPPDFLCDSKIAVEVRRLNKHINYNDTQKPIEELSSRLIPKVYNLLEEIKNDFKDYSVTISIRYQRPLKVDKQLIRDIKTALYQNIPFPDKNKILVIRENLQLRLNNTIRKMSKPILLGSINDYDVGGAVVSMILNNLQVVIEDKNKKVKPYLNNYPEWWLILVNHIWDDLDEIDKKQINSIPGFNSYFDRIILVSLRDYNNIIEIKNNKASA